MELCNARSVDISDEDLSMSSVRKQSQALYLLYEMVGLLCEIYLHGMSPQQTA